jgi:hypothetical protein
MTVGTSDLLHGFIDRFQALQPRGAGKDVDVDRAGFRPGVQNRVRLAEDEDAGQAAPGERVRVSVDDGRPRVSERRAERLGDFVRREPGEAAACREIDRIQGRGYRDSHPS